MMETIVDFSLVEHLYGYNFLPPKAPPVYPRQSSPNRKPYKTLDGYIAVLPYSDDQWLRFFSIIKKENIITLNEYFGLLNSIPLFPLMHILLTAVIIHPRETS